ncbi:hypothetical protein DWX94_13505 [Coprococcus eutactus]|uniref:Tyr recombinase domain-containing protein n=1 Tax=Coprococcus eutactus TaxID=33043 RepID=A0A412IFL8_9FIRM|nr:hypothetical protein DWX94_13505 [Coprococcus eutactus]
MVLLIYGVRLPPLCQKPHINLLGRVAGLKWSDIDMNKKVISINRTLVYQQYDSDSKKEFHIEDPKTAASKRIIPINRQCDWR